MVSGPGTLVDLTATGAPLSAELAVLLAAEQAGQLADLAANAPESARVRLDEVRLGAPVPRPSKIICIGLNYRDHAAETGQELPTKPTVFAKFPTALTGPYDPIVLPRPEQLGGLRGRARGGDRAGGPERQRGRGTVATWAATWPSTT